MSKITFKRLPTAALVLVFVLALSIGAVMAFTGYEPTTFVGVVPYDGDPPYEGECPTGFISTTTFEEYGKFNNPGAEPLTKDFNIDGYTVTISTTPGANNTVDFTITGGLTARVFEKSGNGPTPLIYDYTPAVSHDTGLHNGIAGDGTYADISHISFCITPLYPLTAEKTAAGSYDRTVTWRLDKSVDDGSHSGTAGQLAGSSTWTVVATKTEALGNYKVTGSITINNVNPIPVGVSISDVLDDTTVATVTCQDGYTVSAGGSLVCSYTALPANDLATLNTATITSNIAGVDGATATAGVSFTEHLIGYDSGTLSDSRFDFSELISGDTTETFPDSFTCPADASLYVNGFYSFDVINTAILNGNIGLEDSATVTVDCTLPALVPWKDAFGTYDRTVTWTLDKSVDDDSHSGFAGQPAGSSAWTVVADKTEALDNFNVTGNITVKNPAAIPQTFSVSDVVNGTTATVTCDMYTIPAGGQATCTYVASPLAKVADNTAIVSAAGNPDQTATASILWTENLIGYDSGTLSDPRFDFSETISGDTTKTFPEEFSCPADASLYVNGLYSFDVINTAILNGYINLEDSATVTVDCTLPALVPTKDAAGTYDRTVTWKLTKLVDPASHSGFVGQLAGSSTWTVVADKEQTLDNYQVTGNISVYNPAAIAQTFAIEDYLDDGSIATVTCPTLTVAPLGTVNCTYTSDATFEATKNTVMVTAEGNTPQYDDYTFTFNENLIGYDSGMLSDPRFDFSETISGDTTKTFPESFSCPADASLYVNGLYTFDVVNKATLNGDINLEDSATVKVDCYAPVVTKDATASYDERHIWDVEKSVTPLTNSGFPGDELKWTWTVNVSETFVEENFAVNGKIYVTNPADSPGDMVVNLTDVLDDGTVPTITGCTDGSWASPNLTVAAGKTAVCSYEAAPNGRTATENKATATFNGIDFIATAPVNFVKNVIYGVATVKDTEIGLEKDLTAGEGPWSFPGSDDQTCSTNRANYFADGTYKAISGTIQNWAWVYSGGDFQDSDDATTTWTCNASFVDIIKTTNDVVDATKDIHFKLYDDAGIDLNDEVSTLGDLDGQLQFQTALVPGNTYTVCESPVPAGFTFEIMVDGGNVLTYAGPPGAIDPTGEVQCFDFVAAESPTTLVFHVNNSYPGGAPRTPGYWKNWSTCSGGGQALTAEKLGGVAEGVYLLDDLLPQLVGDLWVDDCQEGIYVLSAQIVSGRSEGKNMAADAAYTLARAYLAALLNQDAGACVPMGTYDGKTFQEVMNRAQAILDEEVNYDGTGSYLGPKVKGDDLTLRNEATMLSGIIDDYNNSELCTGEESH